MDMFRMRHQKSGTVIPAIVDAIRNGEAGRHSIMVPILYRNGAGASIEEGYMGLGLFLLSL